MRKSATVIAFTIASSLAFWPFGQMVDASELEWCSKLNPHYTHVSESHTGSTTHHDDLPHPRICCHQSALIVPILAVGPPNLGNAELAYIVRAEARYSPPPAPFRGQIVPPG